MVDSEIKQITELFLTPGSEEPSLVATQNPIDFNEMKLQLISMGFKEDMCNYVNLFCAPQSIDEAIGFMTQENDVWQHDFIEDVEDQCMICHENTRHRNQPQKEEENDEVLDVSNNRTSIHDIYDNLLRERERRDSLLDIQSNSPKLNNDLLISESECRVCFDTIQKEDSNDLKINCKHLFCKDCWFQNFKEKIMNGEVKNLRCMVKDCPEILPRSFILKMIENDANLMEKYDRFAIKKMVMNNPNMKMCPTIDCDGYGERKNENDKYITCTKSHQFCFNCTKPWHGKKDCQKEIDKDFDQWKKGTNVKRCPQCKMWTEKNEGCNHMTCRNCQYNWCWLCLNHCGTAHYDFGSCFGLQYNKQSCFEWCLCISLYKFALFLLIWIIAASFSAGIVCCVSMLYMMEFMFEDENPEMIYIPACILISLSYYVCFQILVTCILSIVLIPCLFYWPLQEKITDSVFSFL